MRKYIYITLTILAAAGMVTIWAQRVKINNLTRDRDSYKNNTETLLQDVSTYQTRDSLNAAKVGVLELRLSEYQRYRASDAELIKSLRTKNRTLDNVMALQTETITELRGSMRDSIIFVDRIITDTLRCIDINDKWFRLSGRIKSDIFTGRFESTDSLIVTVTTKYKRFLGFLWQTNKVKNREVDVASKNPHTKILGIEYIEIRK